jgi:DNA-binding GntR family transcriptional regulator
MVELQAVAAFTRDAPGHAIAALQDTLHDIRSRAAAGTTPQLLSDAQAADWAMHDAFVAGLGNRLVTELHRVNSIRIRMILGIRIGLSAARLPVALAEHAAILDRIAARDEQGAVEALARHLESSRCRATHFDMHAEQETPE